MVYLRNLKISVTHAKSAYLVLRLETQAESTAERDRPAVLKIGVPLMGFSQ